MAKRVFAVFLVLMWAAAALALADSFSHRGDLLRQWKVAQYLDQRCNPYGLTLDILKGLYGGGPLVPQFNLWSMPPDASQRAGVALPGGLSVAEATYPPFSAAIFQATIGRVADLRLLTALWSLAGLACMALIARHYGRPYGFWRMLLLAMAFFPFLLAIHHGQYSILVLACLLYAWRAESSTVTAGLALAVAMIKPSIMLPFVALFLDSRRLPRLLVAAGAVALLTLYVGHATGAGVVEIHGQWLAVVEYFNFNKHWTSNHGVPGVAKYAVLLFCVGVAFAVSRIRNLDDDFVFAVAGVFSMHYAYHSVYDSVMLFPYFAVMMNSARCEARATAIRGASGRWVFVRMPFAGVSLAALLQLATLSPVPGLEGLIQAVSKAVWRFGTISLALVSLSCLFIALGAVRANIRAGAPAFGQGLRNPAA